MLSERYRPTEWADFIGRPTMDEIREACGDSWLFDGCGERWLFESDGLAGCGKTSAACVEAEALAVLAEEFEVRTAVVINEENILTVVAALNNVVRLTRNDDSGHARHPDNLPLAGRRVNQ